MWPALLMGASAIMGMNRANRQADQQRRNNLAQAEITRYSPWTGMRGQIDNSYTPSGLEGAISGGIQGASMAQGLGMFEKKNPWENLQTLSTNGIGGNQTNPSFFTTTG